jgi:hypothetical protein
MMPNPLQSFAEAKAPPRNKLMGLVATTSVTNAVINSLGSKIC